MPMMEKILIKEKDPLGLYLNDFLSAKVDEMTIDSTHAQYQELEKIITKFARFPLSGGKVILCLGEFITKKSCTVGLDVANGYPNSVILQK